MIDVNGNNLGFILSTPRSGSTLLSAMLGGHELIDCPSEPWILLNTHSMYHGAVNPLETYDHQWGLAAIREFLTPEQFMEASTEFAVKAYNRHLVEAGKKIFIDKTPRYYQILAYIEGMFPAAKKIWLKRNPLDVAVSYLKTWEITPEELTGSPYTVASRDLVLGLPAFAEYADSTEGVFEVGYEQLVSHPHAILEKICGFLNVPFDDQIINYAGCGDHLAFQDGALGDKKLLDHSSPHKQSINQWMSALSMPQIQLLTNHLGREIFERMGYGETVSQLDAMGIKFPSAGQVLDRRGALGGDSKCLHRPSRDPKNQTRLVDRLKKWLIKQLR